MTPFPANVRAYFISYLKHYRRIFIPLLLVVLVGTFFEKLTPFYFSKIIDVVSTNLNNKEALLPQLKYYFFVFVGVSLLFNALRRFGMYLAQKITVDIGLLAKKEALLYALGHSVRFLSDTPAGALGEKVNSLSEKMPQMFMSILWDFYHSFLLLIFTLAMLFMTNWLFGTIFMFWMILAGFVLSKMSSSLKPYAESLSEKKSKTSGRFFDILSNALLVKSFARTAYEAKALQGVLSAEKKADNTLVSKLENARFIQFLIVSLFQISMLCLSLGLWYYDFITTGSIVFVLLLTSDVVHIFTFFMFVLLNWNKIVGSVENSLSLLSRPYEIQDSPKAVSLKVKKGMIEFRHVSFAYNARKKVFDNFSLKIKAGEKVGLVGISGSGKTTFVNLLQRFYDIEEGKILIDGQDIADVFQDSLRENIAVIPQDTSLFHRSVFENIAYGKPTASCQDVRDVSKLAYADEFICALPFGYDSLVGEKGIKLSGGQRQRIAIARAFLKNAPILVLDEATSALDSESEACIQQSLRVLMQGKTVIAIAHRLSTLKEMDRIIVLEKGKIIEQGSAEELLSQNGAYARLWKIQTGK